jgi:hypothetical protein
MRGNLRMSLLLSLALLPLGCGKGYQVAPVSGRVLMDNQPLAKAEVSFYPVGGKDLPFSVGVTDDDGRYTLLLANQGNSPGAVVGEHQVRISLNPKKAGMRPDVVKGFRGIQLREMVPARYNANSKLTCTVPADGRTDADFIDLTSK